MTHPARPDSPADPRHLLVIGAGPGLGLGGAIAHRFAQGGYHLTLLARHRDGLAKLASDLGGTGAAVDTVAADASDTESLRATLTSLYASTGAPGVLVYNASMLMPDSQLTSDITHLHRSYDVDVVGAIVATQVAAPAMRAAEAGPSCSPAAAGLTTQARPGAPSRSARPRCARGDHARWRVNHQDLVTTAHPLGGETRFVAKGSHGHEGAPGNTGRSQPR
jgi:NAD(P)-dependent dehydrogenase (short-subunit alcohol dehydrogenase family)